MRAPIVVNYDIKLFRTGADRPNGILMSLLLLVAGKHDITKEINFPPNFHNLYFFCLSWRGELLTLLKPNFALYKQKLSKQPSEIYSPHSIHAKS